MTIFLLGQFLVGWVVQNGLFLTKSTFTQGPFFFCFVTGVTSQKCRRAPHSKLCQSPSHFRHRLVLEPGYPMSGILQSLLWAYYPGISHRASRTDLQWIIDRPAMRLCYQEAVSYYCSVIVGKPYLTILRGSTGYRDFLALSAQALCSSAHRIVGWRKRLITEQTSSEFHCLC